MPKVSVYLSDELYRRAREHGMPISALTQRAIEDALAARQVSAWAETVRARTRTRGPVDTAGAVAAAKDEFGT